MIFYEGGQKFSGCRLDCFNSPDRDKRKNSQSASGDDKRKKQPTGDRHKDVHNQEGI